MYAGGHLLTSSLAGTKLWPKTELSFPTTIALMLASNMIDFDHMLRYRLDDGTANSLALHWLHVNAGVIFLALFATVFLWPRFRPHALVLGTGLALHFSMDALAFILDYSILRLGIIDLALLAVLIFYTLKKQLPVAKWKLIIFYSTSWLVVNAIQAGLHFIGNFKPQDHAWIYAISPTLLGFSAILFYLLFRKRKPVL